MVPIPSSEGVPGIAPEFDESLSWLNTAPLSMAGLRGHPVALLFWNASSAHCHNALAGVAGLANRFRGSAVVVTIHVPKFDAERDGSVAWETMQAEGHALPLANDMDWACWQQFGVGAWPSLLLVDADGMVRERLVGDRAIAGAAAAMEILVDENFARANGQATVPRIDHRSARGALSSPSGLVATAARLFIADTGHHRILECTHDGRILRRIGHGNRDFVDGLADVSGFNAPRGLALLQDRLYVADTGNHAIRRINTRTGEVDTLVGHGRNGDPQPGPFKLPGDSALDRPWGLAAADSTLLVTQASGHQVWAIDLGQRVLRRLCGLGELGTEDGEAGTAAFAQPTGIGLLGGLAYVLDAASSSLREITLASGKVRTLFGRGLFEFGLKDGGARQALMQSPTALTPMANGAGFWIADSGNGVIRKWVSRNQALSTVETPTALHRPTAVAAWQNWLWMADAGNHLIWRLDVETGEMQRLPVGE